MFTAVDSRNSDGTMFSQNSGLVSHSDGTFSRHSASASRTNRAAQSDLIAFLSIVQKYNVDYLPITWQPALRTLGDGGSGTISQSTFMSKKHLAFKRFHDSDSENPDGGFLPMMSEVLILSQPPIQHHPNIVDLEGICWEIKPRTEKAVPVLIFEKAPWDLQQFMNVSEGRDMVFEDRLKICADIGGAIVALHAYGVIHGDIKPQNVLVFKDAITRKITAKVADFGYSTLAAGESGKAILPRSRPWNAPEHHFGGFKVQEAKKTDVYSFGMLCLWILFGNRLSDFPQTTADGVTGLISFDVPYFRSGPTLLECLKYEDRLESIANHLLGSTPGLDVEYTIRLKEIFSLALPQNPGKRTCDLARVTGLLSQKKIEIDHPPMLLNTMNEFPRHAGFRVAHNLAHLMNVDYRVRTQIRECLEINFFKHQSQPFAAHIAFQLAFCYQIGFGVKSNDDTCHMWLGKSAKQPDDLRSEREVVQPARWKMGGIQGYHGSASVDLIHEYRTQGLKTLDQAREECERVIDDMAPVFGELHFILLNLYTTWGDLLDELGELSKSKLLRMRIRKQIEETNGIDHHYYIQSIINVARSHIKLGEWMEARLLQEEVLKSVEDTNSRAVELIKNNLASTYWDQGRWKEAEELEAQVMETRKRVLGQEHPSTLTSMANLASTYRNC